MTRRNEAPAELANLTTLAVGGPARTLIEATTSDALVDAVRSADDAGEPVLLIAGGSNLVVSDEGFAGTVIHIANRGIEVLDDTSCGGVSVRAQAGEPFDALVQWAVDAHWPGIEALSGIPGSTGATPIQNVGAYGQDVAQTIAQVRTYDRESHAISTLAAGDCGFGYRSSRFKHNDRFVVLDVTFQFSEGELSTPIAYPELARALGVDVGERAPLAAVREAVLALRTGKGMVLDADDPDTRSAGSFFMNPLLPADIAAALPADAPRWPQPDGTVKTSAAWLIERAGFTKGFALHDGAGARVSTKHTLALTTAAGGTAADVIALANHLRRGVADTFGVTLHAEPRLVGVELAPVASDDRLQKEQS